jgi:hypothetical protein
VGHKIKAYGGFAFLLLSAFFALAACMRAPAADVDHARETLLDYFEALHAGEHQRVVELYGGSYEVLHEWNPTVDPADHELLFWYACNVNGVVCLQIKEIVWEHQDGDDVTLTVEFQHNNGELFVLGPCCEANDEDNPAQSQFDFTMRKVDGRYRVLDLPVYTP